MASQVPSKAKTLVLFDVDGTLTAARKRADPSMIEFLARLRTVATVGMVGGSDLAKQREQLGEDGAFPEVLLLLLVWRLAGCCALGLGTSRPRALSHPPPPPPSSPSAAHV